MRSVSSWLWVALILIIAWIILRVALAITSGLLHLLWIGAIIFAGIWVVRYITGQRALGPKR